MCYKLNSEQRKILIKAMIEICKICPNEQRCLWNDGVTCCDFYMNNSDDFNKDEVCNY